MAARYCPKCGSQLLEGARFCSKCRHEIKQDSRPQAHQVEMSGYCAKCGAQLIKGAAFCSKCRAPVGGQPSSSADVTTADEERFGNISSTADSIVVKAADFAGEFGLGEFGGIAGIAKGRPSLSAVLAGLGITAASFTGLMFLPPVVRIIVSAVIAAVSAARLIIGRAKNKKKAGDGVRRVLSLLICVLFISLSIPNVSVSALMEKPDDMNWACSADLQEVMTQLSDYQDYLLPLNDHENYTYDVFLTSGGGTNQKEADGYERYFHYIFATEIPSPYANDSLQGVTYTRVDLTLPNFPAYKGDLSTKPNYYAELVSSLEFDEMKDDFGQGVPKEDYITSVAGYPAKGHAGLIYDNKGKPIRYELDVYVDLTTLFPWAQNNELGKSIIEFKIICWNKDEAIAMADQLRGILMSWTPSISEPVVVGVDRDLYALISPDAKPPVIQDETVSASDSEGEDSGTEIDADIIDGKNDDDDEDGTVPGVIGTAAAVGGSGLLGFAVGKAIDDSQKKRKKKRYKMFINKNFDSTLSTGGQPQAVFARIAEIDDKGGLLPCPLLTSQIQVFSADGSLSVSDGGIVQGYRCAMVSVPESGRTPSGTGTVTFRFAGEGGTYTQNVVFNVTEPQIIFGQENIGVPANRKLEFAVSFGIRGMSDQARVTYEFRKIGVTDETGKKSQIRDEGDNLAVKVVPDKEYPRIYEAVISETGTSVHPAGTTETYMLTVTAEDGAPGAAGYCKITQNFPVYRIHLGLTLIVSTQSIGCYLQLRPERVGVKEPRPSDYEYCVTEGSLLLLDYDEKNQRILRIAPVPKIPDKKTGEPGSTKVYAKKLLADRYAHKSEATKDHQALVDSLGIVAFPTTDVHSTGGRKIKICSTKGGLDAPMRMNAEIEIKINYKGKELSVRREVLLLSQPFLTFESSDEKYRHQKEEEQTRQYLLHVQERIWHNYMNHLDSLYNMIDRMLTGYDERFGFDKNQLNNVIRIWQGFLQGTHTGARGDTEPVTLADELAACYALMQGIRDSSVLGRIALGITTAGYSEVLFTAMTVSDQIREQIYTTRPGETEMDFWDAVSIGVRAYGKQYVIQASISVSGISANYVAKNLTGVDALAVAAGCAQKYNNFITRADKALCRNSALYNTGAQALKNTQNYFNTLAKSFKGAWDKAADAFTQSSAKAPQKAAVLKTKLTPAELKAVEEADMAMHSGLMKVKKLKEVQQKLAKTKGPEKELARRDYEEAVREVWNDKNALKQLQRSNDTYAMNMRAEYNRYRSRVLEEARMDTLDDIAAETGVPREDLYSFNASANSNKLPTKSIPNDSDESFMVMVRSDRSKDFTVDQNIAQNAMARNFYKRMTGKEPPSIEEARAFMEDYDVTVVSEYKTSPSAMHSRRNPEAYADLSGMTGIMKDGTVDRSLQGMELKGAALNRETVTYKGREWYTDKAGRSLEKAAECERAAGSLSGMARESKLAEAQGYRYRSYSQKVEGVRQITKQTDQIIIPRDNYHVSKGGESTLTPQVLDNHAMAKLVAEEKIPLAIFEKNLAEQGLTLQSWGDSVAECLH